ncbi:MAG: hypothetical protein ACLUYK_12745, partial [Eggerthella lenta]
MAGQRCFLIERASCRQMLVHAAQRDPACGHLILAVRPVPALLSEDFVGVHARHGGGHPSRVPEIAAEQGGFACSVHAGEH